MSQPYKICPQCQTPTELHTPFCTKCGRHYRTQFAPPQMVNPAYCLNCRMPIDPRDATCKNCGANQQLPAKQRALSQAQSFQSVAPPVMPQLLIDKKRIRILVMCLATVIIGLIVLGIFSRHRIAVHETTGSDAKVEVRISPGQTSSFLWVKVKNLSHEPLDFVVTQIDFGRPETQPSKQPGWLVTRSEIYEIETTFDKNRVGPVEVRERYRDKSGNTRDSHSSDTTLLLPGEEASFTVWPWFWNPDGTVFWAHLTDVKGATVYRLQSTSGTPLETMKSRQILGDYGRLHTITTGFQPDLSNLPTNVVKEEVPCVLRIE